MRLFTPKRVAQAIGVSESSLKRWCDAGTLLTTRTAGGHRRLELASVLEFLRVSGRTLLDPELLGLPPSFAKGEKGLSRLRDLLLSALIDGNEMKTRTVIIDSHLAGHPVSEIGDQLIAEVFCEIGERWAKGTIDVYQERRACNICLSALIELRDLLPTPPAGAPLAVGASPECDHYVLPSRLAELTLRQAGYRSMLLGASIPLASLGNSIVENKPRLAWLSASYLADESQFLVEYNAFWQRIKPICPVIVGGRAIHANLRREMHFAAFGDQLRHLEVFALSIQPK